jgi:hypothetical protein
MAAVTQFGTVARYRKDLDMKSNTIVGFVAGLLVGGIVLGGVAQARITTINASIAGVLPNSEGSLFCVTAGNRARPITGVYRATTVTAQSAPGISGGATLRCPAE